MLFLLGRTSEEVFVVSSFHFYFIFISFSFQFFDFHFIRAMLLLLGTTFEEVFVVSSFHFWSSFVHVLYLSMFFISFTFRHHPSSFHVFSTHFILSAQHIAKWFATLSATLRFWVDVYPLAFFTLRSFTGIFDSWYGKLFMQRAIMILL